MIFQTSDTIKETTIDFGSWKGLTPVPDTKWLGVTLDRRLTFKRHCDEVIAKGKKRAQFLTSLSNTKWGIPPHLFKILITATVHAATDYAVAAWLNLPVPKFLSEKLMSIDAICVTKALGALKNSPTLFLRHDLDMKKPETRITAKILNTIVIIAAKPPSHPLFQFYNKARTTKPQAHKGPLHAFFQSPYADQFSNFLDLHQPDPTNPLPLSPNFNTLIIPDTDQAIKSIKDLRASKTQVIVYSDGSRIPERNTAATAWCDNNRHFSTLQLGKETEYGIFKAEFSGLILALQLAKHSFQITTQNVTLVLDNEGVLKDMSTKKTTSKALSKKIEAL